MTPPLPSVLREFVRLFNAEAFWECHEVLEGPWREHRSPFYHGLILYASAFVHLQRKNPHGVRAQLEKTLKRLDPLPDTYLGVDLAALRRAARRIGEKVPAPDAAESPAWTDRIPYPLLTLDPERIRGDEAELSYREESGSSRG
jgi:uncharacterized protein